MNTSDPFAGLSNEALADPQVFNQAFCALAQDPSVGDAQFNKNASAVYTDAIKLRMREKPFFRNVLPPKPVGERHLDRSVSHDLPMIIEDMEPQFRKPRVVPFGQPPEVSPVRGQRFEIIFYEHQTPEFIFETERLRTYIMDLRQVTTNAMLMDLGELEDKASLSLVDRNNGQAAGVGESGMNQHTVVNGVINRQSWKNIGSNLSDRQLPFFVGVMNQRTSREFQGWSHNEIGGQLAQDLFTKGDRGWDQFTPGGLPMLVTINSHLVPNGWVYQFTEPGYFGRFYILSDVEVFVKRERDFIRQSARQKIGITLANAAGSHLTRFMQLT